MSAAVIGLTLFAAALHATWNAALRSGVDRLCFVTIMSFATTLAAIPFALLLPLPATQSWTYLGISAVLQVLTASFWLTPIDTANWDRSTRSSGAACRSWIDLSQFEIGRAHV